jgi:hypothetical protein
MQMTHYLADETYQTERAIFTLAFFQEISRLTSFSRISTKTQELLLES